MRRTMMVRRSTALLTLALVAQACSGGATGVRELSVQQDRIPSDAKISVLAEGGIAALRIERSITLEPPRFEWRTGYLCETSTPPCLPPIHFEQGSLSKDAALKLFRQVGEADVFRFRDDYGVSQGADMFFYTIRVVWDGRTKTIRGDDGSLPDEVQALVGAVNRTIEEGR